MGKRTSQTPADPTPSDVTDNDLHRCYRSLRIPTLLAVEFLPHAPCSPLVGAEFDLIKDPVTDTSSRPTGTRGIDPPVADGVADSQPLEDNGPAGDRLGTRQTADLQHHGPAARPTEGSDGRQGLARREIEVEEV